MPIAQSTSSNNNFPAADLENSKSAPTPALARDGEKQILGGQLAKSMPRSYSSENDMRPSQAATASLPAMTPPDIQLNPGQ